MEKKINLPGLCTYLSILTLLFVVFKCYGCISAGTHGSIKAYSYPIKKSDLQNAINIVISHSRNLTMDTTLKNPLIDVTNGTHDTLLSASNNAYVELYINKSGKTYSYTFRYTGDEHDWNIDTISEIFIAYAHNEEGRGGSEGNGDFGWLTTSLKKELTDVFEEEFILKVDSVLGIKHTEE